LINNIVIYTIPFLFVLTTVVFFHELGHFLVARINKVDVESFSVGFGKEIFGFFDKKGTRWKFCWIPLGGYVKFIDDSDPTSIEKTLNDSKNGFHTKSLFAKSLIVSAGPIANFVLAVFIFAGLYTLNGKTSVLPIVEAIEVGSPAMEGGILINDRIVEIDGEQIISFSDISNVLQLRKLDVINFVIERNGTLITLEIKPDIKIKNPDKAGDVIYYVGISSGSLKENIITEKLPIHISVGEGINDTYKIISLSLNYIGKLFIGKESSENLGGPIRIAQISGEIAQNGMLPLLHLTALLSVSIGLINLFPIPMLDGGHLLLYFIEAIRGKQMSDSYNEIFHRFGLGVIILLMLFALWNDLNFLNIF
jgi:regulator of sigma E protease